MFVFRLTATLVLTLWALSPVFAQQVVRPEVDPGLVQKRIPVPEPRQEAPAPLTLPEPPPAERTAPAPALHFLLSGVVIEGNTVLDNAALLPPTKTTWRASSISTPSTASSTGSPPNTAPQDISCRVPSRRRNRSSAAYCESR
jgi:hypothetical protein